MVTIRKGDVSDAGAIADIFNYYIRTSDVIFSNRERSAAEMREKLESVIAGGYPFFVSVEDGVVNGYCYAHAWQPDAVYGCTWELTEYLSHSSAGKGIGTKLLRATVEACRDSGAHTLIACVTAGNKACAGMLSRVGFRLVGIVRESGFKFGKYCNDEFWQLML